MESEILVLQSERGEWVRLFQDVLQESATLNQEGGKPNTGKAPDFSPVAALRLLSTAQNRCAVFLRTQSELECTITEMRKKLTTSESSSRDREREKSEAKFAQVLHIAIWSCSFPQCYRKKNEGLVSVISCDNCHNYLLDGASAGEGREQTCPRSTADVPV